MPQCVQCQTYDTPCWRLVLLYNFFYYSRFIHIWSFFREGPQGARTLCNACGIRWKRLLSRNKRTTKRATTTKKST